MILDTPPVFSSVTRLSVRVCIYTGTGGLCVPLYSKQYVKKMLA